ncbi:hypothetical protein B2G71_04480 [Novosphingobium sp. PC22D]|uniref:SDR family NAD(P)-dependent oxidoreductase n=1 Tax=Novosphingobium sp. PC22D TaxID=1962403 RepID=UPI000BF08088|nr:SDR family oxidoreductase [Novosphingobium sp. PC22D]PEQ13593.1 hypothetical protein B2G71_04480 [Novosphingobium sp. PC22D]
MSENLLRLDGLKVIVTGAAGRGIGTQITRLAAQAGASVLAVDNSLERIASDLAPLREEEGLSVHPIRADILAEDGVAQVMRAAEELPGTLHGLVTVVGGGPPATWGPSTMLSRENWRSQIELNVDSMLFITQAFAAALKDQQRGGSIVSIASICGLTASPYNIGYGAGKAALLSVVQSLALEFARDGIRLNAVAPGATVTPTASLNTEPDRLRRGVPMARFGSANEIAGPVLFLLSDLAAYMTGQCLTVDGGCNLKWTHLSDENLPMFLKDESVDRIKSGQLATRQA